MLPGNHGTVFDCLGKEEEIKDLLRKKVSVSAIGRILGVHRLTVDNFIKTRKLRDDV